MIVIIDNSRQIKVDRMKRMEEIENTILELEKWKPGESIPDKYIKQFQFVESVDSIETRDNLILFLKENLKMMKDSKPNDNKLYLSEIVKKEKPKFQSNNLILAPVGSGKTQLIEKVILNDVEGKVLMLVSNTALKDSLCIENKESYNKTMHINHSYKMDIMTYHEFGSKIRMNDIFAKQFKIIFCDEVHSLPEYEEYGKNRGLIHAIKYLFQKHENQVIYYFTATSENLIKLEKSDPGILKNLTTFNYLKHPDIKKYIALSEYKINKLEQIRPHLKARLESFAYFGYKCLAYNRTISGQKKIEEIAKEEGFVPISIWSINNESEEYKMNEEQLKVRKHLLKYGELPTPYNFLIINSAMQEGWNLYDPKVKLAIINTTNETQFTQALGRYRGDLDVLVYRVAREQPTDVLINLPERYLNRLLTSGLKEELCFQLNIINSAGTVSKWGAVSKLLVAQGYQIKNSIRTVDGKRVRVSEVTIKK